jgi:hypothetical protein
MDMTVPESIRVIKTFELSIDETFNVLIIKHHKDSILLIYGLDSIKQSHFFFYDYETESVVGHAMESFQ